MRPHTLDPVSLLFGLFFVGAGGWVLLDGTGRGIPDTRWILPVLLLVTGVAVLASVLAPAGSGSRDSAADAVGGGGAPADAYEGRYGGTVTAETDAGELHGMAPETDDEAP